MKGTKQKILDQARVLFNSVGVTETTLRQIALAIGISQGNLNYHFKTRQELVEALYFELVAKMDQEMGQVTSEDLSLKTIFLSSRISMSHLYEYRFLLKNSLQVMKVSDKIKTHFMALQKMRRKQFLNMFQLLTSQGIMREEAFTNEYDHLYERLQILGDHWISSQELMRPDLEHPVDYYAALLFEMIYPYLTASGRQQYREIISVN